MDIVSSAIRSKMMAGIKAKNTAPEIKVRKFLHAHGFRFRIHRKDLPGNPDIVLPKLRACIFVHGCFWHRHVGCQYSTTPKTRTSFWTEKFSKNIERDTRSINELRLLGWRTFIVWECELKHSDERLESLLNEIISNNPV
ncbi:very short patch repair endonuclease [Pseudomonas syringae]|uniref:very short patch repair endonuclease n=1 Tax=Pseudomonas syringae TaxID=317 RepID=UPI0001E285C5